MELWNWFCERIEFFQWAGIFFFVISFLDYFDLFEICMLKYHISFWYLFDKMNADKMNSKGVYDVNENRFVNLKKNATAYIQLKKW